MQKRSTQKEKEKREMLYKAFILSLILLIFGATYYLSNLKAAPVEIQKYPMPQR